MRVSEDSSPSPQSSPPLGRGGIFDAIFLDQSCCGECGCSAVGVESRAILNYVESNDIYAVNRVQNFDDLTCAQSSRLRVSDSWGKGSIQTIQIDRKVDWLVLHVRWLVEPPTALTAFSQAHNSSVLIS